MTSKAFSKDNGSRNVKAALRQKMLGKIKVPVILECNGGYGALYNDCYRQYSGITIEKDPKKTQPLADQRPGWAVYEGKAETIIRYGACFHLPINFIDVDTYGSPWGIIDAIFDEGYKYLPDKWVLVVNDGTAKSFKFGIAWKQIRFHDYVVKYGNSSMAINYNAICRDIIEKKAQAKSLGLSYWTFFNAGYMNSMTHFSAVIERS